ncbi:MAG: porin [bacterium]
MSHRKLLGLTFIVWSLAGTSVFAKDSVVGFKVTDPSPTAGRVVAPQAEPQRSAKSSVIGQKTLKGGKQPQAAPAAPEVKTEAPPPPAPEKEPVKNAGYSKGFFIQTSDEKYRLNVNGYAQFELDYDREKGENKFGFKMRNVRLTFSGHLATKKLTYKLQVDFAKFKDELLLDAWTQYKFNDNVEIRVGQQDVPWIRQSIISSSNLEFSDRSLATLEFLNAQAQDTDKDGKPDKLVKNGRDIGVVVQGRPFKKKLEYNVGFFNGSGTNTTNFNNHLLYTGRAVYNITGDANYEEGDFARTESIASYFGASGNYNVRDLSNDKVTQFGAESGIKYKGLALQGEFFYRHTKPGDTALATANDYGYYAQAGYFVVPKHLEVVTRASQVFLQGLQNDKAEFAGGLNYYVLGQHIKLQSDYSVLPTNTKEGVQTSQRWRLKLQTKF